MKTKTTELTVGAYTVRWSRKPISRLHLRIKPPCGEILLSTPMRVSRAEAERFVGEHLDWIARSRPACIVEISEPALGEGECVPLFGREYPLAFCTASRTSAALGSGRIVLSLRGDGRAERVKALTALYRTVLEERVSSLLDALGEMTGLHPSSVRYRRMTSKWGSCLPGERRICLNLYLALYDPRFLEYVLLHELVHLRHPNHGQGFYAELARYMPDWRERKVALTEAARALRGRLPI